MEWYLVIGSALILGFAIDDGLKAVAKAIRDTKKEG